MVYKTRCPLCGIEHGIEGLTENEIENIERYKQGMLKLHSIFEEENNTPLNRELVKTGICDAC